MLSGGERTVETATLQADDVLSVEIVPRGDNPPVIAGLHLALP
jgi:hypothetical protein